MFSSRSLLTLVTLAIFATSSRAQDQVIDDVDTAWNYSPATTWGAISDKSPCPSCNTQPDPEKAHGKTWHDLSKGGSAQLSFTGSGVVVYAICPKGIYRSNFTFLLDNEPAGQFLAPEGGCADYTYNQIIFHKSGLEVGSHIFQVNNWISPGAEYSTSDLVIDYAVVTSGTSASATSGAASTTSDAQPSSTPSTPRVTATFDDVDSAWSYTGSWGAISAANPCKECVTQPDPTKARGTTWHDLSQPGSATLLFTGTGVKVYTICPGPLEGGGAFRSNFAFTIDGKPDGTFIGDPNGCKSYEYNQLVYTASNLEQGSHNFTITNVIAESGNPSDLILDYAVVEGTSTGSGGAPPPTTQTTSSQLPTFPSLSPAPVETNDPGDAAVHATASNAIGLLIMTWAMTLAL